MVLGCIAVARSRARAQKLVSKVEKQFGLGCTIGERVANGATGYYHYPVFANTKDGELAREVSDFLGGSFRLN